ncbi:MAG: alpha/beta fold hydrolase [Bacilli bacterium]
MNNNIIKIKIKSDLNLYGKKWLIEKPVAQVVIVTGMEEHSGRYDTLAKFLNEHGYNVFSLDYFGQGENVKSKEQTLGNVPPHAFNLFTDGLAHLIREIKEDKPLFMLGHSMGSFLAQEFAQRYGDLLDKLVLVGSNGPDSILGVGFLLAKLTVRKGGYNKTSKLLASMAIGGYQKSVKDARTSADWISYNEDNVNEYLKDSLSGITSSKGFYKELLRGTSRLYKKNNVMRMKKILPILIIAGQDDPVGKKGKGVEKLYKMYSSLAFTDVLYKIYPNMRHEILNEKEKMSVFNDVLEFMKK